MAHEAEAVGQYLRELAGAATGATVVWGLVVPLAVEFSGSEAIPGWFWVGLAVGIIVSAILTTLARRIERARPRQRA